MKSQAIPVFMSCLFFALHANGQQPEQSKTTTTTTVTTTTEQKVATDTLIVVAQEPVKQIDNTSKSSEWKGFHAGGIAQATFTDIKVNGSDGEVSTSYVVGYGAGGFLGYFCGPHFEVRLEALYSALAQDVQLNDSKQRLNLSYINFPLLVGLHTGYNKTVSFNIMAGPQIGINTGSKLEGSGSEGIDTIQASVKVKPADIGLAYGAGLDFGFGPEKLVHLNVGFRGVCGIVDISDQSNNTTTNSYYILDRSKLMTYSGYAGLSFKF